MQGQQVLHAVQASAGRRAMRFIGQPEDLGQVRDRSSALLSPIIAK